jgi:hypothetical protein
MRKLRASNSIHSEIAAAVSIELGVRGPWQLLSNGCSSGLDAHRPAACSASRAVSAASTAANAHIVHVAQASAQDGRSALHACFCAYRTAGSSKFKTKSLADPREKSGAVAQLWKLG